MSVCKIRPVTRWYQLQDQSGMNYETIRVCRVDSYSSGGNLEGIYNVCVFMSYAWSNPQTKLEQTQNGCHVGGVRDL